MKLEGKTALVTGGAIRIGRSICLALAEAGAQVCIHYRTSAEEVENTRIECEARGVKAWTAQADLAIDKEASRLFQDSIAHGPVQILINNAAIFPEEAFQNIQPETWDHLMNINLRAPFLLSQAFAKQIHETSQGKIINLLDQRVHQPGPDHLVYRLSKSALMDLTKNLALELAPGITVNGIAPGAILPPKGSSEKDYAKIVRRIPLHRMGNPDLIGQAVIWILKNDFMTGEIVTLDGGQHLG